VACLSPTLAAKVASYLMTLMTITRLLILVVLKTMKRNNKYNSYSRPLIVAGLLFSNFFPFAAPLLAQTAAGTGISNTATATYEDPNAPGTPINATSNTVTITVAEVSGVTVSNSGISDPNGGSISTGDTVSFDFLVTNVGNDTTNIFIPGASNLTTAGLSTLVVTADLDGDGTYETTIPATGFTTTTPINAGGTVKVRVEGVVTGSSIGDEVSVQLGNATTNNGTSQSSDPDGANANEVRTVDVAGEPAPRNGAPINGESESGVKQTTTVGVAVKTVALATVLKTRAAYVPGTSATNDDQITYRLDLRVESTSPDPAFAPGNLEGTLPQAQVTGVTAPAPVAPETAAKFVLISDVIPANTTLDSAFTATPPAGWQVVYSTNDPATTAATAANWTTNATGARRIGWVYTGAAAIPAGTSTVTSANGFQFKVTTTGLGAAGGQIANMAQVFGETVGETTNAVVYDESGDQRPNNFNDDGTTPDPTGNGGYNPSTDLGVADPATQGTDPSNQTTNNASSNQGTGADGEVNLIAIVPPGNLVNGPNGVAGATGPEVVAASGPSNQSDFTNKSSSNLPAGSTAPYDPDAVTFNNTVTNPSTTSKVDNLVIAPILPSQADFVADGVAGDDTNPDTAYGTNADIPPNTTVTITLGSQSATYRYEDTNADGIVDTVTLISGTPVTSSNVGPGTSLNYTVTINPPANTAQSDVIPVPVVAFVDEDGDKTFDRTATTPTDEPLYNVTVDRLYTGYMKLVKEARLLDVNGNPVAGAPGQFSQTPTFQPEPGQIIEYRITYRNFSTPASGSGSGSVVLNASNFRVFEDGLTAPNTWAAVSSHVLTKAVGTAGTVSYYSSTINTAAPGAGIAEATANTGYVNFVGTVAPAGADPNAAAIDPGDGTFTFQRKLN
jgi:hypothetical protein